MQIFEAELFKGARLCRRIIPKHGRLANQALAEADALAVF